MLKKSRIYTYIVIIWKILNQIYKQLVECECV